VIRVSAFRSRIPWVALATATVAVLSACANVYPDAVTVRALVCEECVNGEYDSVTVRGNSAIPQLLRAMSGPGTARELTVRNTAMGSWARLSAFDTSFHLADSTEIGNRTAARFRASWQARAMLLLRKIGTPEAKWALRAGLTAIPVNRRYSLGPSLRAFGDSLYRDFP